jgi:hypothetical protein
MKNYTNGPYGSFIKPVGAELIPLVNQLATSLTTFPHSTSKFQSGKNVYPGQEKCDSHSPHALWHIETSIAMLDFVFLADELHRLINTYAK